MIKKIIFNTAKEAFRKGFKKYKKGHRKDERVPYDLVKSSIKRSIRSTKFMDKAAYQQAPKTTSIPRGGNPRIVGKAYASDRAAKKTMMIPMMTAKERAANQKSISQSVRKFISERMNRKKYGGVMKAYTGKAVRQPSETNKEFEMRHAYHTPFMKYKPKMLLGGLLTKGIRQGIRSYVKASGKKTKDLVKLQPMKSRTSAKTDMARGIQLHTKSLEDKKRLQKYIRTRK